MSKNKEKMGRNQGIHCIPSFSFFQKLDYVDCWAQVEDCPICKELTLKLQLIVLRQKFRDKICSRSSS